MIEPGRRRILVDGNGTAADPGDRGVYEPVEPTMPEGGAAAPRGPAEEVLAGIWRELLGLDRVGIHDDFFALGGHSLLAVRLFARIEAAFGRSLPLSVLFERPTIGQLARLVQEPVASRSATSVLAIQPGGPRPRLYFLPSVTGETYYTRDIIRHLLADQPVYGFQPGAEGEADPDVRTLEVIAARYVEDLCAFQPDGPYCLAGYSFGGMVAYEMARQLASRGKPVELLAILDTGPGRAMEKSAAGRIRATLGFLSNLPWWMREDLLRTRPGELWTRAARKARRALRRLRAGRGDPSWPVAEDYLDVGPLTDRRRRQIEANLRAFFDYLRVRRPYPGRLTLFRARAQPAFHPCWDDGGWGDWASGGVEVRAVPGNHKSMLKEPFVRHLAGSIQAALERV